MIVLDTNVVSALMRQDRTVVEWVSRHGGRAMRTTASTIAEIEYGLARMPEGRRRDGFAAAARQVLDTFPDFALPFDEAAAREYGPLFAERERSGRPMSTMDAQIAAVCRVRRATLATRNVRDFDDAGIDVVDPWSEG